MVRYDDVGCGESFFIYLHKFTDDSCMIAVGKMTNRR